MGLKLSSSDSSDVAVGCSWAACRRTHSWWLARAYTIFRMEGLRHEAVEQLAYLREVGVDAPAQGALARGEGTHGMMDTP